MEERMIVSGGDEVRVFAPPKREPQEQIRLEGAGALCVSHGTVFCATEGFLHAVSRDGMRLLHTEHAPGRAGGCQRYAGAILLFDGLSERIFARSSGGCWNLFCGCARDMQRLSGKG